MKITGILAIFTLNFVVKGWVQILQPITLAIGSALTALNFDSELIPDIEWGVFKKTFSKLHNKTVGAKKREKVKEILAELEDLEKNPIEISPEREKEIMDELTNPSKKEREYWGTEIKDVEGWFPKKPKDRGYDPARDKDKDKFATDEEFYSSF